MTYAELREAIDDDIEDLELGVNEREAYSAYCERRLSLAIQLRNEAEDLAGAGLIADAERRLACFLSPKWSSFEDCKADYNKAMNR